MAVPLNKIKVFAAIAHKGQSYGDEPYLYHLMYVVSVLERFGFDDDHLLAVAWLHDVVEDTDVTLEEVKELSDGRISALVGLVTDKEGDNRRERHEKTYPHIGDDPEATVVKLADRIANVENCILNGKDELALMYLNEHARFLKMICRDREQFRPMWDHLDQLFNTIGE